MVSNRSHGNHCQVTLYLVHSASRNQSIKIYSTDSDELVNSIRYHDGFMGQKIGPTRCLAFHPYKVKNHLEMCYI